MELSVIIVNYRVEFFLELCLFSVEKAIRGLDAEIFVVDNHSGDDSIEYLQPKFPNVQFIENKENIGFGAANNQALAIARGKHILFLNPDTVLPEDFFTHYLSFLESTPRIGGLGERAHEGATDLRSASQCVGAVGVKMIDGSGHFLKESSRGFPSAWVAFCKLAGLTALFPHSRLFAGYYLGHLSPGISHPAPVLSGACLLVRREILDKTGGFDEQFFMYAEDIDLSYRIEQAGYSNYYLADTTIIHFKGESTQKDTRYVKQFYKAMSQFRRKHFRGGLNVLFNGVVETGIWLRAGITALNPKRPTRLAGASKISRVLTRLLPSPPPKPQITSFLTGDPEGIKQLSEKLSSSNKRILVTDPAQATEIIFCEGKTFSFKQAISLLEASALRPDRREHKFYAAGSSTVTGSASRDGKGATIIL